MNDGALPSNLGGSSIGMDIIYYSSVLIPKGKGQTTEEGLVSA